MINLYYFIALLLLSCSSNSKAQEALIIDYLETSSNDIRTDLKIDILELEISDVTVADSVAILEAKFQEKIDKEKESIKNFNANIQSATEENKLLDRLTIEDLAKLSANESIIELYEKGIAKAQLEVKKAQDQKAVALSKYQSQEENLVLVKRGVTNFSFFNPKLNTRQERTETFVLSKDGSKVLGMVYNGKLRRKR